MDVDLKQSATAAPAMAGRRPWRLRAAIAVVALLVLGGGYFAWKTWFAGGDPATRYTTATVQRGDLEDTVTATGTIQPRDFVDVGIEIYDAKNTTVKTLSLTTDEFGGASGEYTLGEEPPLGVWHLSVNNYRPDAHHCAGALFRVEEYKKPEFEVSVKPAACHKAGGFGSGRGIGDLKEILVSQGVS